MNEKKSNKIICGVFLIAILVMVSCGIIYAYLNPPETMYFEGNLHGYEVTDSGNRLYTVKIGNDTLKNVALSGYDMETVNQFLGKNVTLVLKELPTSYDFVGIYV